MGAIQIAQALLMTRLHRIPVLAAAVTVGSIARECPWTLHFVQLMNYRLQHYLILLSP